VANIGATTLGDAMIMVATDSRTPSPKMTSADRRVKRFAEQITKRRQSPLLELPRNETALGGRASPSLPKRRRRIVAQSIAYVPTAKRCEHLFMKHLGLFSGRGRRRRPRRRTKTPAHIQVLHELFPADGEVGARN
jgi:hypothetical protein